MDGQVRAWSVKKYIAAPIKKVDERRSGLPQETMLWTGYWKCAQFVPRTRSYRAEVGKVEF